MALPTLPYDKSLHVNYGAVIAAFTVIWGVVVIVGLRIFGVIALPLWPLGLLAIFVSALAGKLKEVADQQANEWAAQRGLPAPHSVEAADIRATAWGGVLVGLPSLFTALTMALLG